ncbi:hypothetical protein SynPROSU1_01117 [Synechococcus sp. PROS-U-1]|nr:hypothetical protein SynPROSU1_01117 [Synechococcus sp. PROS-U-1]
MLLPYRFYLQRSRLRIKEPAILTQTECHVVFLMTLLL